MVKVVLDELFEIIRWSCDIPPIVRFARFNTKFKLNTVSYHSIGTYSKYLRDRILPLELSI